MKNTTFIFRGILICYDEIIGYFFNKDSVKYSFHSKDECLKFIQKLIN